jgi:hypothetical protein
MRRTRPDASGLAGNVGSGSLRGAGGGLGRAHQQRRHRGHDLAEQDALVALDGGFLDVLPRAVLADGGAIHAVEIDDEHRAVVLDVQLAMMPRHRPVLDDDVVRLVAADPELAPGVHPLPSPNFSHRGALGRLLPKPERTPLAERLLRAGTPPRAPSEVPELPRDPQIPRQNGAPKRPRLRAPGLHVTKRRRPAGETRPAGFRFDTDFNGVSGGAGHAEACRPLGRSFRPWGPSSLASDTSVLSGVAERYATALYDLADESKSLDAVAEADGSITAHEHLLSRVLRVCCSAQHAPAQCEHVVVVLAVQSVEIGPGHETIDRCLTCLIRARVAVYYSLAGGAGRTAAEDHHATPP